MKFVFPNVLASGVMPIEIVPREIVTFEASRTDRYWPLPRGALGLEVVRDAYVAFFHVSPVDPTTRLPMSGFSLSSDPSVTRVAGHSLHLAALLALVAAAHEPQSHPPGLRSEEVLWATGALESNRSYGAVLKRVSGLDRKLPIFLADQTARYFLVPRTAFDSLKKEQRADLPTLSVATFVQRCRRPESRNSSERAIILVESTDIKTLVQLFSGSEVPLDGSVTEGTRRAGLTRKRRLFAWLMAASLLPSGFAMYRLLAPPCYPVDARCFALSDPKFEAGEVGILVEQASFRGDQDWRHAVDMLQRSIRTWRDELRDDIALNAEDCAARVPEVRLVAVPAVRPDLMRSTNALLAISGPIELKTTPSGSSQYVFRRARSYLNLRALLNDSSPLGRNTIVVRQRQPRGPYAINYRETRAEFFLNTLNSLGPGDNEPASSGPKFVTRYSTNGTLSVGIEGDPPIEIQNLNKSINSEFALLEKPGVLYQPTRLTTTVVDELTDIEVESYLKSLLLMHVQINDFAYKTDGKKFIKTSAVKAWLGDEKAGIGVHVEMPPSLKRIELQMRAELTLLSMSVFVNDAQEACDDGKVPDAFTQKLLSSEGNHLVRNLYQQAAELPGRACWDCYLKMAQLMYDIDDIETVLKDLGAGVDRSEGLERARLLLLAAKYRAATILVPDRGPDPERMKKALSLLHELRALGFNASADFEEARLLKSWYNEAVAVGASDPKQPVELLRSVLSRRPKHLLSRFLLAKLLDGPENAQERVATLRSILEDLNLSKGQFQDDLHSLGELDDVHHTVDPTFVLEDLVYELVSRCDKASLRAALNRARKISGISWDRVQRALTRQSPGSSFYVFPGLARLYAAPPYSQTCPSFRTVQAAGLQVLADLGKTESPGPIITAPAASKLRIWANVETFGPDEVIRITAEKTEPGVADEIDILVNAKVVQTCTNADVCSVDVGPFSGRTTSVTYAAAMYRHEGGSRIHLFATEYSDIKSRSHPAGE